MMGRQRWVRSLRWRVLLAQGLLLAITLAALAMREWRVRVDLLKRDLDNDIYRAAFLIDAALHGRGGAPAISAGFASIGEASLLPEQKARGMYYIIWQNGNSKPSEISENAPPGISRPTASHEGLLETPSSLRAWFINSEPGDYVVAGRSLERDHAAWRWMALRIAGLTASIWAGVMLASWWLVGRELRLIQVIATTAERIAVGDLGRRIETREAESELGSLATILNQTFAQLETAFARQARFTADAAHELRTPVAVILTHSQNSLSDAGLSDEQRDAFECVERAAQRMRQMIGSLLQLARLDAGTEDIPVKPFDLSNVAAVAVGLLRPVAQGRNVTLITHLDPSEVDGDAMMIEQVIVNLADNAIRHGCENGVVEVRVRKADDAAVIEVADDGPGISPVDVPHVFDRFYRGDSARTSTGSNGLGLAISKAIVEAHHGTITVSSRVGAGTIFTVCLPGSGKTQQKSVS